MDDSILDIGEDGIVLAGNKAEKMSNITTHPAYGSA